MVLLEEKHPGLPVLIALIVGALIGYVLAWSFAMLIGGLPGLYFTLATMAGTLSVGALLESFALFGNETGIGAPSRGMFQGGHQLSLSGIFWLTVVLCVTVFLCLTVFSRSRFSRIARSSSPGSPIADAVGYSARRVRVQVMGVSGLVTALAGGLYASSVQFVDPSLAGIQTGLALLAIVILGGRSLGPGPIVGAILIEGLPVYVPGGSTWATLIVGAVLIVALVGYEYRRSVFTVVGGFAHSRLRREDSAFLGSRGRVRVHRSSSVGAGSAEVIGSHSVVGRAGAAAERDEPTSSGDTGDRVRAGPDGFGEGDGLIRVESLSISYDGVHAISDLSMSVRAHRIHAVIGPNGAGKSSLLAAISGSITPTGGHVIFEEGVSPEDAQEAGVRRHRGPRFSRTFQTPRLVEDLSIESNVEMGCAGWARAGFLAAFLPGRRGDRRGAEVSEEIERAIAMLGLEEFRALYPERVPIGVLRMTEVARCIATRAKVLLLDEPAAGLGPSEKRALVEAMRGIREAGKGVVLVEHDMSLVSAVADYVTVLAGGKLIAEGTVEQIWNNHDVTEVYLEAGIAEDAGMYD